MKKYIKKYKWILFIFCLTTKPCAAMEMPKSKPAEKLQTHTLFDHVIKAVITTPTFKKILATGLEISLKEAEQFIEAGIWKIDGLSIEERNDYAFYLGALCDDIPQQELLKFCNQFCLIGLMMLKEVHPLRKWCIAVLKEMLDTLPIHNFPFSGFIQKDIKLLTQSFSDLFDTACQEVHIAITTFFCSQINLLRQEATNKVMSRNLATHWLHENGDNHAEYLTFLNAQLQGEPAARLLHSLEANNDNLVTCARILTALDSGNLRTPLIDLIKDRKELKSILISLTEETIENLFPLEATQSTLTIVKLLSHILRINADERDILKIVNEEMADKTHPFKFEKHKSDATIDLMSSAEFSLSRFLELNPSIEQKITTIYRRLLALQIATLQRLLAESTL